MFRKPQNKHKTKHLNLSNPKPGHTTGGSGRGARWGGGAGSGRIGCQQNCLSMRQASLVLSKASKTRRLNVSPEPRTSEILCKPKKEQNPRLTSSPVQQRFNRGTRSALRSWLLTSAPTHFCLCKPFSCKRGREKTVYRFCRNKYAPVHLSAWRNEESVRDMSGFWTRHVDTNFGNQMMMSIIFFGTCIFLLTMEHFSISLVNKLLHCDNICQNISAWFESNPSERLNENYVSNSRIQAFDIGILAASGTTAWFGVAGEAKQHVKPSRQLFLVKPQKLFIFCWKHIQSSKQKHIDAKFLDMPCKKRVYIYKKRRRSTGQQPGTKSASRPSNKMRVNRLLTAGQPRVLFLFRFT